MYVWVFKFFLWIMLMMDPSWYMAIVRGGNRIEWFSCYQLTPQGLLPAPPSACPGPQPQFNPFGQ